MAGLEVKPSRDPVPDGASHQRELLPFCGLHNLGGYAEQPTTNIHLYGGLDASGSRATNLFPLPAEAFTQPFSSHTSPYSPSSQSRPNPLNLSKRSWQDEDETSRNPGFFFAMPIKSMAADVDDVPVSPLSETPPQAINMLPASRQVAQPKSRIGAQRPLANHDDIDMEFENAAQVEGRVTVGSGSDFEESDFMGRDVDMEGM